MKKYIYAMIGVIGILIIGIFFMNHQKFDVMNYYFPEDFHGCAIIFYDIPNAPPLQLINREINYYFDENGILLTSSPQDFGWEGKKYSGGYKANYYRGYELIDHEEVIFSALGEVEYPDKRVIRYEQISIGKDDFCSHDYFDAMVEKYIK